MRVRIAVLSENEEAAGPWYFLAYLQQEEGPACLNWPRCAHVIQFLGLGWGRGDPRPLGCLPVLSSEHQEEGRSSQARGGLGMSRETPSPWGCVRLWRLQSPGTTNCSAEKQNCRLETLEAGREPDWAPSAGSTPASVPAPGRSWAGSQPFSWQFLPRPCSSSKSSS